MENNNLTLESIFLEADESTMKDFYNEMVKRMFGRSSLLIKPYQFKLEDYNLELPHFYKYERYIPYECTSIQCSIAIKREK